MVDLLVCRGININYGNSLATVIYVWCLLRRTLLFSTSWRCCKASHSSQGATLLLGATYNWSWPAVDCALAGDYQIDKGDVGVPEYVRGCEPAGVWCSRRRLVQSKNILSIYVVYWWLIYLPICLWTLKHFKPIIANFMHNRWALDMLKSRRYLIREKLEI